MPNTASQHNNRRRATKRARSSTPVVTRKAQATTLKRALARKSARQTKSDLVDHAVPKTLLQRGVHNRYGHALTPEVDQGDHTLSPFILSLKQELPSPNAILEEQALKLHAVNLLDAPAVALEHTLNEDLSQDLIITTEEIQAQLASLTHTRPASTATPRLDEVPNLSPTNTSRIPGALRHAPHTEAFQSDAFVPYQMPEDIFAYFDFPEDELAQEADVVTLEEIEATPLPAESPRRRTWSFPSINLPMFGVGWQRAIASFVILSFAFVLPLHAMNVVQDLKDAKIELEQTGNEAVSLLSAGAEAALARNVSAAGSDFQAASERFSTAQHTIAELGAGTDLLLSVIPVAGETYQTGQALIDAGQSLAIAGSRVSAGYAAMEAEINPTPISRLNILETYLTSTVVHLEEAQTALARIEPSLVPPAQRDTLELVQSTLPTLITTIEEFEEFYALAKVILGGEGSKRYLIIFQNNTEIRPTGGFIGSFAEVKVHDGIIEQLNVPSGGSYDLQGWLTQNLVAPKPLQLLKARWEFQDANWFADFPTSARQMIQFYESAGGPTVDGVLAINATYVADLIGLLGDIEMPEYNRTITAENFIFEAQKAVEIEYDREENNPKAFIGDLAPRLVERAIEQTTNDFLSIVDHLNRGLSQKDIQLYLSDDTLQRNVIEQGWGGEVKWTTGDYLMVVDTNLGGGKTDGVIDQHVDLDVEIAQDGTITNTVTINRTHYGIQGLLFTGVNNVNYLRVYVPKGATLMEATGFSIPAETLFNEPKSDWIIDDDLAYSLLSQEEDPISGTIITEEHGKTVFGNWVQTKPGTTSTVTFRYVLPFKLTDTQDEKTVIAAIKSAIGIPETHQYQLTIQKQSGVLNRSTTVHMDLPPQLNPLWASHDLDDATVTNETDALFAILMESL